ncbi:MAG: phosphoribosyltransferase family protein [Candidatus Paceibacterota bacterium]|jgi:competence protein ComFC
MILQGIKKIFETILSILLPKEEKILEIENLNSEYIVRELPKAAETNNPKFKALFQYKNKIVKQAIWEIKYKKNKGILEKFSKALYDFILEEIGDELLFNNFQSPILVPIPTSKENLRERGYNQCELIIKELIKIDGGENFSTDFKALKKIKETKHQAKTKNKMQRLKNLDGCFYVDKERIKGKNIILIDDVITTGATMKEARQALEEAGTKKVIGFALGH